MLRYEYNIFKYGYRGKLGYFLIGKLLDIKDWIRY